MARKLTISIVLGAFAASAALAEPMSTLDCSLATMETKIVLAVPEKPDASVQKLKPADLEPSRTDRFLSALTLKFEILDQADFTAFSETRPSLSNPDMMVPVVVFRPARDEELFKGSLSLDLASLFDTVGSLNARYKQLAENRKAFDLSDESEVDLDDTFNYFAMRRVKDLPSRFLSGFSLSVGLSERAEAANGPRLPGDEEEETFSLTFDPAKLFVSDKDIQNAIASTVDFAKAYRDPTVLRHLPSCSKLTDCFKSLAEKAPSKFWRVLLPTFEAKSVDQFDFFTLQDRFRTTSLLEASIETYTFTWNLKRAFDSGPERLARLKAAKQLAAVGDGLKEDLTVIPLAVSSRTGPRQPLLLPVTVKNKVGKASLEFERSVDCPSADKEQVFPGLSFIGTQLVGYPGSAGRCRFLLKARDEVGRESATLDCTLEVRE